jgi:hypothetical protein
MASWAEYGSCPVTVGVDAPPPPRPASVPEGAWVAHVDDAPEGALRVDDGEWANPFKVGRDGSRTEVNRKYEKWLLANPDLMARLPELAGRTLTSRSYPLPSHAETLSRWANDPSKIPVTPPGEAPIPKADAAPARVWRPADEAPIRIMVTGTTGWTDMTRVDSAISWATRNARTTYPGRQIELIYDDAAKPANTVASRPHVVLAFDKDGAKPTAATIRAAREAGLPVYAFHDTQGIPSHSAYPGRDNPDAVELTDATEADYGMQERDVEELGYHDPTIPFRGINRELARYVNSTVFIPGDRVNGVRQPGRDVYLKQAVPEKHTPIADIDGYETRLADTAYAAEPDWAFWGQSRPQMSKYDHRYAPYTDSELELAGGLWGEEMDNYITTLSHRAQTRNKEFATYDYMAMMDSPLVRDKAEALGKEIDTWIRDRRLIERGVTPEEPAAPQPKVKERAPQKIDEVQVRRDAADQFQQENGRPPAAANPEDMAALEAIKAKIRGNDVSSIVVTERERQRAKYQSWERYASRPDFLGGPRQKLEKRWPDLSPVERQREINSARFRGIIIDPQTGAKTGTVAKAGQTRLVEEQVTQDGVTGTTLVKAPDPNERIVTNPDDAPEEITKWRDPLDSDRRLSNDDELEMLARDKFEEDNGRPPLTEDSTDPQYADLSPDERADMIAADAAQVAVTKKEMYDDQQEKMNYGGTVTEGRGITAPDTITQRYEDSGEITPQVTGATGPKERAKKQVSLGAQQLIQQAIDIWPKGFEKPKVKYPKRPGLDAYSAQDADRLRAVIYLIAERTGGIAGSPTAQRNARQEARIRKIVAGE